MSTTVLSVRMELLSDTLFGSGFSLSGGADLSAKRDEEGFPYVSGTTFKGLLREGLERQRCGSGGRAAGRGRIRRCGIPSPCEGDRAHPGPSAP